MANQNSRMCYVPQPYFVEGTCTVSEGAGVASIANSEGIFDPDLSNYMTVTANSGVSTFDFTAAFDKVDSHLVSNHKVTVGCIGCSLTTYADNAGAPDLNSPVSEDILIRLTNNIVSADPVVFSFSHNSQNDINTFCKTPLRGIISGGRANIIFSGWAAVEGSDGAGSIEIRVQRLAANVALRPHAIFEIGHLFIGVEIPIIIDPRSFSWTIESLNDRFKARDLGAKSSEGTLLRQPNGEIIKIQQNNITGSMVDTLASSVPATTSRFPNFFDLIKVNNSYPLLFNPYPVTVVATGSETVDYYNLTVRQNFFAVYGFLDGAMEFQTDEFRDGLNSEYRARFRVGETR